MSKIIFMGTPDFAATILQGLIESQHEVIAVVTQPDRPVGRKKILTPSPVKELALTHDISIYQPEQMSHSQELEELLALDCDFIVTAAYGQFLPPELLEFPRHASINVHASLLPKYRGGAPIHYAIWQGEQETGVSIIYMVDKMDAGDIISQSHLPITSQDDVGSMFEKLAILGKNLLIITLDQMIQGTIKPRSQNEDQVTYSPTIKREQEKISWLQTSHEIDRHVRAFRPFPSTYTILEGKRVKIWAGQPVDYQGKPQIEGSIVHVNDGQVIVQAGNNTYYAIEEWQDSGKKRTLINQWLNGNDKESILGKTFSS